MAKKKISKSRANKKMVRLHERIEAYNGGFSDPYSGHLIAQSKYDVNSGSQRGQFVEVTPFVEQRLSSGDLIEVLPDPPSSQDPSGD